MEPLVYSVEGGSFRDRIHEEYCVGVFVEVPDDRLEGLLPGSVPDLHLDHNIVEEHPLREELHSDGWSMGVLELILDIPEQEAAFAHVGVADDDELERDLGNLLCVIGHYYI